MNFLELVKIRQSDRAYDISRPVEQEKLDHIFETGWFRKAKTFSGY